MQYTVLLHRDVHGNYEAMLPVVPSCAGKGKTRREALDGLKNILQDWLTTTEITTIDIQLPKSAQDDQSNPWLTTAGMFQDDPFLDTMLQEIYALRNTPETVK